MKKTHYFKRSFEISQRKTERKEQGTIISREIIVIMAKKNRWMKDNEGKEQTHAPISAPHRGQLGEFTNLFRCYCYNDCWFFSSLNSPGNWVLLKRLLTNKARRQLGEISHNRMCKSYTKTQKLKNQDETLPKVHHLSKAEAKWIEMVEIPE